MLIRSIFIFILLLQEIFSCPIPFHIQSKCRCAITELGRVYIYCARKQLTVIPHFNTSNIIFDELVLSGNRISVVHKNAFNGLKLRKLELQSNPINQIETNAFIDLANYLEELILSTTHIPSQLTSEILLQILSELPNLKRLSLRLFDLSDIARSNQTAHFVLRKLIQLSLQSCSIQQIDDVEIFVSRFPNLERLDLSENRLEYLNLPLISSLKKLKTLILSKNKIRHLQYQPSVPSNSLLELDLSYNGIETIDENLFESISSQLEILNLRNNELSNERQLTFLVHFQHLREFYLDYNRLESISQLHFPLSLKLLSLRNNRLNQLDLSLFTRLESLEKLFLSSNKLTKLSSKIKNFFASLETLELDRNYLAFIQSLNAPKLKQLNLDGNFLGKKIEKKIFANLPALERLHLRDNQIELIDPNAFQNTRLQSLDLRNNSLKTFPRLNKINDTLQILSLRRNQLCTLEQSALDFYPNLLTLELDQNPLHCDCRMERNFKQTKITGQCESPPERKNVDLNELPNEQFTCSIMTTAQCSHLTKTITEDQREASTTTVRTTRVEKIVEPTTVMNKFLESIRIGDLSISSLFDQTRLLIQWRLLPSTIDNNIDPDYRRKVLQHHEIQGFKISSNSPIYKMSELIDLLQRNYTLDYQQQTEICLYLLRKNDYEKVCKQLQFTSTQTIKSSLIIDPHQRSSSWYLNEPAKSILIGSLFGILFVLILLIIIILIISRCPYLLFCHLRPSRYHQNNDSKSESLLVRPTPTNTMPWPIQSQQQQQQFYPHQHPLRPCSYQASLSTQCSCPTHYHSSSGGSSSSTGAGSTCTHGQNYHIYQEILNDDLNPMATTHNHYRTCHSLKPNSNSPLTSTSSANTTMNSEQCQLCSLSALV